MGRYFEIISVKLSVDDIDRHWYIKRLWFWLRMKAFKRYYRYGFVADVSNNQKLNIGDRFIAGNYYPPLIFEVRKKLGKKTIVAQSVVASTLSKPELVGKCIVITK